MKKYDKDVVEKRFRSRRRMRKTTGEPPDRMINWLLTVFAVAALLLLIAVAAYYFS